MKIAEAIIPRARRYGPPKRRKPRRPKRDSAAAREKRHSTYKTPLSIGGKTEPPLIVPEKAGVAPLRRWGVEERVGKRGGGSDVYGITLVTFLYHHTLARSVIHHLISLLLIQYVT